MYLSVALENNLLGAKKRSQGGSLVLLFTANFWRTCGQNLEFAANVTHVSCIHVVHPRDKA